MARPKHPILPYILPEPISVCIAYCIETTRRAANDSLNPEEVQRMIRQQEQTRDAERRLDEVVAQGFAKLRKSMKLIL